MKRDWDLIRRILLKLEEKADAKSVLHDDCIQGYDREIVSYHFKLLHEAKLIVAFDYSGMNDISFVAQMLTWEGHELLDKIRNDSVWNTIKISLRQKSVDLSMEAIKTVSSIVINTILR